MLRLLAEGLVDENGERLESEALVRTLDRIEADAALAERLDALDARRLRTEFLVLYRATRDAASDA